MLYVGWGPSSSREASGSLRDEGALAIAGALAAFDQHRAGEGSGTGTV
jgi:hypothetical protein